MVALDIDGTLVDHEGVLPEEVRRSVRRVVTAGVPVVLATGRGWHATRPVFEQLGLPEGPAVTSNGAVTVTLNVASTSRSTEAMASGANTRTNP